MKFSGHLYGGILTGTVATTVGLICLPQKEIFSSIAVLTDLSVFLRSPLPGLAAIFLIGVFMSLFPDLDICSIPQKWFYRIVLSVLVWLWIINEPLLFAALSFISLLPLIHRHRGWTHRKWTPWVISFFGILFYLWFSGEGNVNFEQYYHRPDEFINDFGVYIFACVLGHYTHLFLDIKINSVRNKAR
ncbi:MAG: hypothetical protein OEY59_10670 [Deltaproteobacteria bacterium]|nr:hypothetical protein [Deltaproteobacteria bacterium]